MTYDLPRTVEINGTEYEIRTDFRVMMDVFEVLNDVELQDNERGVLALGFFYPDFADMPPEDYKEAINKLFWFIRGGSDSESDRNKRKLMDWEQDYQLVIAPVNRVVGRDVRTLDEFHWWSFLSAFMEIGGDCTFTQVVSIRTKLAKGKSLDKQDSAWYRENRNLVDIKGKYSTADNDILSMWGGVKT